MYLLNLHPWQTNLNWYKQSMFAGNHMAAIYITTIMKRFLVKNAKVNAQQEHRHAKVTIKFPFFILRHLGCLSACSACGDRSWWRKNSDHLKCILTVDNLPLTKSFPNNQTFIECCPRFDRTGCHFRVLNHQKHWRMFLTSFVFISPCKNMFMLTL